MITILLATFNGEKFVSEQLDSILQQTVTDFSIEISDDGSTDGTLAILEAYRERYPEKIAICQNTVPTGSPKFNFFSMMKEKKNDYVMLCDQDDVWLSDKIEKTLEKMRVWEEEYGKSTPLLVYTDLTVVDEDLQVVSPSFKKAMNANYKKTELRQQLIQNTLTGCTVMYNRALADLIFGEPQYMVMHDWWLMLIASAFGRITDVEEQTILYRQHKKNEIGAKDVRTIKYKINKLLGYKEMKKAIYQTYEQAESFLSVYGAFLQKEQKELLAEYCKIPQKSKFGRWRTICRLGVLKNGIARKIANFIFI